MPGGTFFRAFGLFGKSKKEVRSNDGYYNGQTDFRSYFISFDDGARLEIMNRPDMQDIEKLILRTGYIHVAFSVGSKEKVDRLTELLKSEVFYG